MQETFICLDCETTGLDVDKDEIIEFAAIRFTFKEHLETLETLIDPKRKISEDSIAIHHITDEMVEGKPSIESKLVHFFEFVGPHPIVGHGIGFDIQMLEQAARKHNFPFPLHHNPLIDTHRMARLYGKSPTNSLEALRAHFHVDPEIAHRALSDVLVNIEVFKHLCRDYSSLEHILTTLSRPITLKEMPLGKHRGRPFREIPYEYLLWASKKDFDQDLSYSIHKELKRRRKGNQFLQEANPFKHLSF